MQDQQKSVGNGAAWRSHAGIPIRNLWMLLIYAHELAEFYDELKTGDDGDAEIADILARALAVVVERRLQRILSRGYRDQRESLTRVRGRIDWLETKSNLLLERGRVACRFEELTIDTTRNRLVLAALESIAGQCATTSAALDCRQLAHTLRRAGVTLACPSPAELSRDRIARHERDDRLMTELARLALDLSIPSETAGEGAATRLDRNEALLRRVFEKAVAGLYRFALDGQDGWKVRPQRKLRWQSTLESRGMAGRLPSMQADIILDRNEKRIVVDTKFTNALKPRQYDGFGFDSGHIYQLYAYLRSQVGAGDASADAAEGVLLYPAVDKVIEEEVVIQGHRFRFVAVDLSAPSEHVREALLNVVRNS